MKKQSTANDDLSLLKLHIPRWLSVVYGLLACSLIPWIIILGYTLPSRHISRHWDLAWVGFDVMLLLALVLTAIFSIKRSGWVSLSATMVFSFLLVDVWFDILTSRPGHQTLVAIGMAILIELPLAFFSLWLALRVTSKLLQNEPKK